MTALQDALARYWGYTTFKVFQREAMEAVLAGRDSHTQYQWLPPGRTESHLRYQFCKRCGIRTFGYGGDRFIFINIAALQANPDDLASGPLRYLDGRNDRYDRQPEDTRFL